MLNRRQTALVAFTVALFLVLLVLSWIFGLVFPAQHGLRFEAADGSVRPVFVVVTRPQLVPVFNPGARIPTPGKHYVYRFYFRMDRLQPVSSLSFWVRDRINSLGFRGVAPRQYTDCAPNGMLRRALIADLYR
jgi:hypothetical protein